MDTSEREALLREGQSEFFRAMLQGYATEAPTLSIDGFDGWKFVQPYRRGPWHLIDGYFVGSVGVGAGTTFMSFKGEPFWYMQYHGWYSKQAIPFLKASLLENYRQSIFIGGRGPRQYTFAAVNALYVYTNNPDSVGTNGAELAGFACFAGTEMIVLRNKELAEADHADRLGCHRYHGGAIMGNSLRI